MYGLQVHIFSSSLLLLLLPLLPLLLLLAAAARANINRLSLLISGLLELGSNSNSELYSNSIENLDRITDLEKIFFHFKTA